jgi:ABC-type amino acid transport substrate-binding protein
MKFTRILTAVGKLGLLVAGMAVTQLAIGQGNSGDTFAAVKQKGSGTIALAYVETPGFVYKDNAGNLTGICVDIMNDFVKYVNETHKVKLTTRFIGEGSSFSGMYNMASKGKGGVFGLGNVTITEARKKEVTFSPPFITNFAILVTQNHVATLKKMDEIAKTFEGMTAYTSKGTLNETRTLEIKSRFYPTMNVSNTASSPATLEKVIEDKNGFAYMDLAFYLDAVKRGQPLKRHPIGDQKSEEFGFVMPQGSDWAPVMDAFFSQKGGYTNSAEYKKILNKHLGQTGVKLLQTAK